MKLLLVGLLLIANLAHADGGIKNRKTKSIISVDCVDSACTELVFVEKDKNEDSPRVISRKMNLLELVDATEKISSSSLDKDYLKPFTFTEMCFEDFKSWFDVDQGGNPVGGLLLAPAGIALLAVTAVTEGAIDGTHSLYTAISNKVKSNKLSRTFENQIGGDQQKLIKLNNKNYKALKESISKL